VKTTIFICTDFLTGEQYVLNLPIEETLDTKDMLFVGHCFYGNTMVMNYIRGLKIGKLARKRLRDIFCLFATTGSESRSREPTKKRLLRVIRSSFVIRSLSIQPMSSPRALVDRPPVKDYEPSSGKIADEVASQIQKRMREGNFRSMISCLQ
jgi:hypothetical protein